jgi:hypothetical protein
VRRQSLPAIAVVVANPADVTGVDAFSRRSGLDAENIVIDVRYTAADDAGANSLQGVLASDPAQQILSRQGVPP